MAGEKNYYYKSICLWPPRKTSQTKTTWSRLEGYVCETKMVGWFATPVDKPGHTRRICQYGKGRPRRARPPASGHEQAKEQAQASISTMSAKPSIPLPDPLEVEQRLEPESAFGNCFTIDVLIDGVRTCCLLDTGLEVTTLSEGHFFLVVWGQKW